MSERRRIDTPFVERWVIGMEGWYKDMYDSFTDLYNHPLKLWEHAELPQTPPEIYDIIEEEEHGT